MPISTAVVDLLEARKADGVLSDLHVFARAATNEFDRQVSHACRQAAKQAKISYGRFDGDGFTLHSLRHKSYQSFSVYLHKIDLGESAPA